MTGIEAPVAILPMGETGAGYTFGKLSAGRAEIGGGVSGISFGGGGRDRGGVEGNEAGGGCGSGGNVHPAAVVFGRSGAAAVVAVPLSRSAFFPVPPSHTTSTAASDAASLLCGSGAGGGGGIHVPAYSPVTSIAPMPGLGGGGGGGTIDAGTTAAAVAFGDSSPFLVAAGGTLSRVAPGVASIVTPVSPPGFGAVTALWGVRARAAAEAESMLVLSFSQATRVFTVRCGTGSGGGDTGDGSATFEEAVDGAGLETGQTTIACGRFGDGMVAQVNPKL